MRMYSIRDNAVELFQRPWFARSDGEARRIFGDEACREGSELHKHPTDYALFHVGDWDENTGHVIPVVEVRSLGLAISYQEAP